MSTPNRPRIPARTASGAARVLSPAMRTNLEVPPVHVNKKPIKSDETTGATENSPLLWLFADLKETLWQANGTGVGIGHCHSYFAFLTELVVFALLNTDSQIGPQRWNWTIRSKGEKAKNLLYSMLWSATLVTNRMGGQSRRLTCEHN